METSLQILVALYALLNFTTFIYSLHKVKNKKGAFERVPQPLIVTGSFVWADHVVFGLFWTLASLLVLYFQDFLLMLLIISVFWLVRSVGESMYWFLQQFSQINRNPPESFRIHKIFHNSSVWFVHQIYWQALTVTTIITTLALAALWVKEKI